MKTRIIYKERCPICHRALKVDNEYKSLSYVCRDRYPHYEYVEIDYGSTENTHVKFTIPDYSIHYNIEEKRFEVYDYDGQTSLKHIVSLPTMDFKWNELKQLSERIKKLITFS